MKNLKSFEIEYEYDKVKNEVDYGTVSYIKDTDDVKFTNDREYYTNQYLTFENLDPENEGCISLNIILGDEDKYIIPMSLISYSTDNGKTWTSIHLNNISITQDTSINIEYDKKVLFKGTGTATSSDNEESYIYFNSTTQCNVSGNIMSLLYSDNFNDKILFPQNSNRTFNSLFDSNENLINAENLILPATTLVEYCYTFMFYGCTSLTTAPILPATTLAQGCYLRMFNRCTSLTTAPELPSTTLSQDCYNGMFNSCTSLTTAPILPATTLAQGCYNSMFNGCTSLTTAPILPATTLVNSCYSYMFEGCTSLNLIIALFTTTPSPTYTQNWVRNVSSYGKFIKNENANWNVIGVNGVPTGWSNIFYINISNIPKMILWIDDFSSEEGYYDESTQEFCNEPIEDVITKFITNPYRWGSNTYIYYGDTIMYNGNKYFLWKYVPIDGNDTCPEWILTTTINYNKLYSQSLENTKDIFCDFTYCLGQILEENNSQIYNFPNGEGLTLVKVRKL